jgi:transportin-3
VWIIGKIVCEFGNEEDPNLRGVFKESYDRVSEKVLSLLQEKSPAAIPDGKKNWLGDMFHLLTIPSVLEDHMHMLIHTLDYAPDVFFDSPKSFSIGFRAAMTGLTLIQTDLIFASLDLIRLILTHDSILPPSADKPVPPKFPIYASRIQQVIEKEGYELIGYLLSGLTGDFPEDSSSNVITIFRNVAAVWPQQLLSWLPSVLQQLNPAAVTDEAKAKFLAETTRYVLFSSNIRCLMRPSSTINAKQWDKIKYAILGLHRQSLKARERRRTALDRQ